MQRAEAPGAPRCCVWRERHQDGGPPRAHLSPPPAVLRNESATPLWELGPGGLQSVPTDTPLHAPRPGSLKRGHGPLGRAGTGKAEPASWIGPRRLRAGDETFLSPTATPRQGSSPRQEGPGRGVREGEVTAALGNRVLAPTSCWGPPGLAGGLSPRPYTAGLRSRPHVRAFASLALPDSLMAGGLGGSRRGCRAGRAPDPPQAGVGGPRSPPQPQQMGLQPAEPTRQEAAA